MFIAMNTIVRSEIIVNDFFARFKIKLLPAK